MFPGILNKPFVGLQATAYHPGQVNIVLVGFVGIGVIRR
jgi:hypothetical protein